LYSKGTVVTKGHDNWLSNMGYQDIYEQVIRGAIHGQVDKLEDPRARLMTGKLLNVGEGFNADKNKANGTHTKMQNFFADMDVKKKKKK
jgi:hypothetical protein